MKPFDTNRQLGALKALLSPHVLSQEINSEIARFPKQTIIGLGQGGGRIAAELSRFGFPTFLINSSKSDMEEHKGLIPDDRRIVTKSKEYPELEGTDKNAQLGFQIAVENKEIYKKVALSDEVQDADFVWVTVSLGGGTGNGALKVALTYLSEIRATRALTNGKIPLGVICSLPSSEEKGSSFRKNALAGISLLQQMMNEGKIGNVLVIDNEKMNDYYAKTPLRTYAGTEIDAKSYSNIVVATSIVEISSIPLIDGRSVFDKTELLTTLSTPGWLSISKTTDHEEDDNLQEKIQSLFKSNEVLADYEIKNVIAGAVGVLYPNAKNISQKIADDVYKYTSDLLHTKVNFSVGKNSKVEKLTFYGLAVLPVPPIRIQKLMKEKEEWERIEKEQEEAKKKATANLGLDQFSDFFSVKTAPSRRKQTVILDDLDDSFGSNSLDVLDDSFIKTDVPKENKRVKPMDLDDIDF